MYNPCFKHRLGSASQACAKVRLLADVIALFVPLWAPYTGSNCLVHCAPYFLWLHCIKLPDHEALTAEIAEALIEHRYHLVGIPLLDVPKPILHLVLGHLLHHCFMWDACWVTVWVGIIMHAIVLKSMTRIVCNVYQHLRIEKDPASLYCTCNL